MRFVVQSHSAPDGEHYDLMLEEGPALATWRIDRLPSELPAGQSVEAVELPAHRLAYLEYEGPISRGRGSVRIADAGEYVTLQRGPEEWQFELRGRQGARRFILRRLAVTTWRMQAWPD